MSGRRRSRAAAIAFRDYSSALVTMLLGAREDLDEDDYPDWIAIGIEAFGYEGARLAIGEALRARNAGTEDNAE